MPVASVTAFLYLNNTLVGNVTNTDYLISSKIIYNFIALTSNYEICINGSYVNSSITKNYADDFSPLIDNVSLIQIGNSTNSSTINITNSTNSTNSANSSYSSN